MINNNSLNAKNHELIRYRTYHASSGLVTSISQSHGPKHGPYINQHAVLKVTYSLGRSEPCYIMQFDNICSLKVYKIFVRLNLPKKTQSAHMIPIETRKQLRVKKMQRPYIIIQLGSCHRLDKASVTGKENIRKKKKKKNQRSITLHSSNLNSQSSLKVGC